MFDISRRHFLTRAPLAVGAVALESRWAVAQQAPSKPKSGTDLVTLGSTGIKMSLMGISCHTLDALGQSANCDWLDVQLARINPFGSAMDGPPETVVPRLKGLRAAGKGVIGMKICGGGRNMGVQERLESLRFVLGLGCVDAMTIGCESVEQIDENLALIEKVLA